MSGKLSDKMFAVAHAGAVLSDGKGVLVPVAGIKGWAAEVAALERKLAEALAEPTTQELINAAQHEFDAFKSDDVLLVSLFIAARRARTVGEK